MFSVLIYDFLILSFWGFLILLFPICFFCHFVIPINIDYRHIRNHQQIIKKKIKIIVGTYTLGSVLIDLGYAAKITQNGVYSAKSIKKNTHLAE